MAADNSNDKDNKQLRSDYRDLLTTFKHEKHDIGADGGTKLMQVLEKANELHSQVSKPREQAVDSELFLNITDASISFVKRLGSGAKAFTPADLIRRIKANHSYDPMANDTDINWTQLGACVSPYFATVPITSHMLGPMDAVPKKRKVAQRQKRREPLGEAVRPEEIANLEETEKQETDKNMEEMWRALKGAGGNAPLAELVLHHDSFAQTVENLFTLSFLVRDTKVELQYDKDRGTMVYMRVPAAQAAAKDKEKSKGIDRVQFVVVLDYEEWEEWCRVVERGTTLMPHREPRHGNGAAAAAAAAANGAGPSEPTDEAGPSSGRGGKRRKS